MAASLQPLSLRFLSSPSPPPPPKAPPAAARSTAAAASPSLSDQLHSLSLTLLKDPAAADADAVPHPKPIWVNPTKPLPSVLSPRRHPRSSSSSSSSPPPTAFRRRSSPLLRRIRDASEDSAFFAALEEASGSLSRDDALFLLKSLLRSPEKTLGFVSWLHRRRPFELEAVFYNVALKSLRLARRWDDMEALAGEMAGNGVKPDNITYSTLISAARQCRRFDKAVELFDRMYAAGGVLPDEVTYSAMLDVYAQLGKTEEVVSLFERARAGGWTPDAVAFAVLAKMFGSAGDYDGIQFVLREMRVAGVKPNLVVYNTLLKALGKAGRPGLAKALFAEMVDAGVVPDAKTLTAVIKIYGKARWGRDALELWRRMRQQQWPADFILYNTLLSMCADLGLEAEAEELFADMRRADGETPRPDCWSYAAMINIYSSGGKGDEALGLLEDMVAYGLEPNVMSYTCLIQCLGKAGRLDDMLRVFDMAMARGVRPDDRLCGCLLSVTALDSTGAAYACLARACPPLAKFITMLGDDTVPAEVVQEAFRGILNAACSEVRRPYCNCLIDISLSRGYRRRAAELLRMGTLYGLYGGLHSRSAADWTLNLRSLSVGAATTAFDEWLNLMSDAPEEDLPPCFSVHTGTGSHKFSQGLASTLLSHLEKNSVPFRRGEKAGSFIASKEELAPWLLSRKHKN